MNELLLKLVNAFGWTTREDKARRQLDGMESLLAQHGPWKVAQFMQTADYRSISARYFVPEFVGPGTPLQKRYASLLSAVRKGVTSQLLDELRDLLDKQGPLAVVQYVASDHFRRLYRTFDVRNEIGPKGSMRGEFDALMRGVQLQAETEMPGLKSFRRIPVPNSSGLYYYDLGE